MKVAIGDHLQHRILNKACLGHHDSGEVPEENGQDQTPGCLGSLAHIPGKFCDLPAPANGPSGRDHYPLRFSSEVIHYLLLEAFLTHPQPTPSYSPHCVRNPPSHPRAPMVFWTHPHSGTYQAVFFVPGIEL